MSDTVIPYQPINIHQYDDYALIVKLQKKEGLDLSDYTVEFSIGDEEGRDNMPGGPHQLPGTLTEDDTHYILTCPVARSITNTFKPNEGAPANQRPWGDVHIISPGNNRNKVARVRAQIIRTKTLPPELVE